MSSVHCMRTFLYFAQTISNILKKTACKTGAELHQYASYRLTFSLFPLSKLCCLTIPLLNFIFSSLSNNLVSNVSSYKIINGINTEVIKQIFLSLEYLGGELLWGFCVRVGFFMFSFLDKVIRLACNNLNLFYAVAKKSSNFSLGQERKKRLQPSETEC